MAILRKETIEQMYRMKWGIFHIIGPIYIAKKYSPATTGLRRFIWTIEIQKNKGEKKK